MLQDSKALFIEGSIAGPKGPFDCPMQLNLFGTSEPTERGALIQTMDRDRLPTKFAKMSQRVYLKQSARDAKEAEKQARKGAKGQRRTVPDNLMFTNLASHGLSKYGRESIEDIIGRSKSFDPREMGQVVEKFGVNEEELAKMPMADCPPEILTELLPYQRQGLAWMLERESPSLPGEDSDDVVQLWKRSGRMYQNIATNYSTSEQPPLASGGILADDMGLGKTIQVISLILANSKPRMGSSKTNLIISPLGVMSNWRDQIARHVRRENAPNVLIYHGPGKKEASNLENYDVVITTYGALASEYGEVEHKQSKKSTKGLFSVHWRRVVLDEGHTIRSPRTKGAKAACTLNAASRWSLTGTPIINNLKDLYSQISFLKLSGGLEDFAIFNSTLIRPLNTDDPNANLLLQALMATICLRRKKDMHFVNLRLPKLSSHVLHVKFLPHEQEKYDILLYVLAI